MRTPYTVIAIAWLSLSPLSAQPRLTLDWEAMAERVVAQLAPEPGEKILLVARPGNFDDLIPHLRYALLKAGAVDLGVIDVIEEPYPQRWDPQVLQRGASEAQAVYRTMLRDFDGAIMLPGARPGHPAYSALQDLLREGHGRTVHFHWTQNGSAFPIPGQPLPQQHVIDATYQRALLETDYVALARCQGPETLRIGHAERRNSGHVAAWHGHPFPYRRPAGELSGSRRLGETHGSRGRADRP